MRFLRDILVPRQILKVIACGVECRRGHSSIFLIIYWKQTETLKLKRYLPIFGSWRGKCASDSVSRWWKILPICGRGGRRVTARGYGHFFSLFGPREQRWSNMERRLVF